MAIPIDDSDRTMQALHDAILEALFSGGVLPPELLEKLFGDPAEGNEEQMRAAARRADPADHRADEGVGLHHRRRRTSSPRRQRRAQGGGGGEGEPGEVKFEVTDKALDFLGYRALRDLLGSLGHSSAGRHDTRDLSTGIEASGAPKPYEFGDTMNLDATATILNAVTAARTRDRPAAADRRRRAASTSTIEDLMVAQGEYQSSCATVLMLDCSHSMILYGEDRFTPAKRVAMALSHLIRTQYPGDTLHAVLFHDTAEEIPLRELGRVRVGPYYTNTREGPAPGAAHPRAAAQGHAADRDDHRRQAVGADAARRPHLQERVRPRSVRHRARRFAEVSACAKAGIMINTFMLARDYDLVAFVRRVAAMCRGKAYFTTPYTLGQYVLMDYMDKKTQDDPLMRGSAHRFPIFPAADGRPVPERLPAAAHLRAALPADGGRRAGGRSA